MTRRELDRRRELKKKYGMTFEDWEKLKKSQGGKCAICERVPDKLVTDHCHKTGKVCGLLCDRCNRGIGLLRDNSDLVGKAAEYLKKNER